MANPRVPFAPKPNAPPDPRLDVAAALNVIAANAEWNVSRIFVVGHSLGAGVAIAAGTALNAIEKIVAVSPPVRTMERLHGQQLIGSRWEQARAAHRQRYGTNFPEWYTLDTWRRQLLGRDISAHVSYFAAPHHKPLLLIDGERESDADRRYLNNFFEQISFPKAYVTLRNSDVYMGVAIEGGNTTYDAAVMQVLSDTIDQWLRTSGEFPFALGDRLRNFL